MVGKGSFPCVEDAIRGHLTASDDLHRAPRSYPVDCLASLSRDSPRPVRLLRGPPKSIRVSERACLFPWRLPRPGAQWIAGVVDRIVDRAVAGFVTGLVVGLVDRLVDRLVVGLVDRLVDLLVAGLLDRVAYRFRYHHRTRSHPLPNQARHSPPE